MFISLEVQELNRTLFKKHFVDSTNIIMGECDEMDTGVSRQYRGKSVFVTGGSGFLGKALIEKLLYSCPGINKMYLLMREKSNKTAQQRVDDLFKLPVFSRLREEKPWTMEKVTIVNGDLTSKNLGLSELDEKELIEKVSYVFHLGATVNFKNPIERTFDINVNGTERLMNLCKRMKSIQKFVYVSTAYSNSNHEVIEEKIYPFPLSLNAIKKQIIGGLNQKELKKLLDGRPNGYTFTKAIAEMYINEHHGHVPSIIVRPSIVVASLKEPLAGWLDSWSGANYVIYAIGLGLIRVMRGKYSYVTDLIPVDYVINLTIVAATTDSCHISGEVSVYNSCSSELNPIILQMVNEYVINHSIKNKIYKRPNPNVTMSVSSFNVSLLKYWNEILPMYLNDVKVYFKGEKGRNLKLMKKLHFVQHCMDPFIANSWVIRAQRTKALFLSLPQNDKDRFPFNPEDIVWSDYMYTYCDGINQYLHKTKY